MALQCCIWLLQYNKREIATCIHIPLPPFESTTEPCATAGSQNSFPLAVCLTHGTVDMSVLLPQCIPPSVSTSFILVCVCVCVCVQEKKEKT